MNLHTEKASETKSTAAADRGRQHAGAANAFQFEDNRPSAVAQRKLNDLMQNSPRMNELRAGSYTTQVIQPKIITTKAEDRELDDAEIERLAKEFIDKLGESNEPQIRELLSRMRAGKIKFSIRDVSDVMRKHVKVDATRSVPLDLAEIDQPLLPSGQTVPVKSAEGYDRTILERRRFAIRQLEFSSVTQLTAKVLLTDGSAFTVELRNQPGARNAGHAEKLMLVQIEERAKGVPVAQITMTINNSPCGWCGPDLAEWKKANGDPVMVIHFINAYGDDDEFAGSIAALTAAGIRVYDFNPIEKVGYETDEELEQHKRDGKSIKSRFEKQVAVGRARLKKAREGGGGGAAAAASSSSAAMADDD